jgi:DNA-directed RNA polymerase specialized sigma subunit
MNFEKEKNQLTEEEREVINGYFEDPKTFKEIMGLLDNLGITLAEIDSNVV